MEAGGCKKRKRGDTVFSFRTFCEPGNPAKFDGPFHQNIRALLQYGAHLDSTSLCGRMRSWSFRLDLYGGPPPVHVSLFVIEEPIEMSLHRHCHQCRYVGWGHHMICNRRFHFVLPSKETMLQMPSSTMLNWVQLQGHLMHGVMHSNGFGHLLSLNGIEKGSELVKGYQIMDLWDRICTSLHARKVSLIDVAKKRSMELRWIHGVAYGEPWFGRWGYRFGRGCYGVTQQMHHKAIQALQGMPLCLLVHQLSTLNQEIPVIVARYQTMSRQSLQTLGHLFRFMLELKGQLPQESPTTTTTYKHGVTTETACRWSSKRVEMAVRVIVEALRKAEFKWVSRQEIRDAARAYIGDTGLLDFVLKSLGNHIVGNYVVRRTLNPVTKVLEYRLEDISNVFPNHEGLLISPTEPKTKARFHVTMMQLTNDMFYLYKHILKEQKMFATISTASRIILDTKHLIKQYDSGEFLRKTQVGGEETLKLSCTVWLEEVRKALHPHELVILPAHCTIEELKREVERRFREMYWCMRGFVAESIDEVNGKDSNLVCGVIELGSRVMIRGKNGERSEGIYEVGNEDWTVECPCGAKEDDGEGMIACDVCEVRQHRRCVGASENDVPQVFLCSQCEHKILVFPSHL